MFNPQQRMCRVKPCEVEGGLECKSVMSWACAVTSRGFVQDKELLLPFIARGDMSCPAHGQWEVGSGADRSVSAQGTSSPLEQMWSHAPL